MNERLREFLPHEVPALPGVYIFRDRTGRVIYVGKAKKLRSRLSQYFQPGQLLKADAKKRSLINSIFNWEYFVVKSEDEALILESKLIKDYAPHYNVLMRDDKRYLLLKLDHSVNFPTLRTARLKKDDNATYFGPFPKGTALKATLEFLLGYFGLRFCKDDHPDEESCKRCLKRIVKDCMAPCRNQVSKAEYAAKLAEALQVLNGNYTELSSAIEAKMADAAAKLNFEKAAGLRDIKENIEAVFGRRNRNFEHHQLPSPGGIEAVESLQKALKLPALPNYIECFDISNISGKMAVASMVVFINGRPARSRYRRFRIKTVFQSNDFAMMAEAVRRHYRRKMEDAEPMPSLLMVDGGKGQLSSAIATLTELGAPAFPVIGLAKKQEEIFIPGRMDPVILDHHHAGLRMLQALRDESHRFAITYHRALRQGRISESILDDIPQIGKKRKHELLRIFGSVKSLRQADAAEIAAKVPGIGSELAEIIYETLRKGSKRVED